MTLPSGSATAAGAVPQEVSAAAPVKCTDCGGAMRVIGFIEDRRGCARHSRAPVALGRAPAAAGLARDAARTGRTRVLALGGVSCTGMHGERLSERQGLRDIPGFQGLFLEPRSGRTLTPAAAMRKSSQRSCNHGNEKTRNRLGYSKAGKEMPIGDIEDSPGFDEDTSLSPEDWLLLSLCPTTAPSRHPFRDKAESLADPQLGALLVLPRTGQVPHRLLLPVRDHTAVRSPARTGEPGSAHRGRS